MRRFGILLSIAAAVVVLLIILAAVFLNVNRYRPQIQAELQKSLNRPVSLGELHLHIIPFSVKADGLTIGESPAFPSGRAFATAKEVYVSAGLFSLIGGHPDVHSITLQQPQLELIRNAAGAWNFADIGASNTQSKQSSTELAIHDLKITDGQVAVTDQHAKTPRTVYNHIDASVSNFAPAQPFDIEAAAHFPGAGKELISFKGTAGPIQPGNTPLNGQLSIEQVSLASLNAVTSGAIPPQTDASASGDATVHSAGDIVGVKGALALANAVVRGTPVSYPIDLQYDLSLDQKTDALHVSSGSVKIGSTLVSLAGQINSGVKPAQLDMHVGTNNASIPDLLNIAALAGAASSSKVPIKGALTADLAVRGASTSPTVQGTLSSPSLQAQDIALTNVQSKVDMANGVLHLSPVTAGLFGGQENGDVTLDTKTQPSQCHVKTKLTGVDANALLSALTSMKDTLYGALAADADLGFNLDSGPNLTRTLNGTLSFNVSNGHLKNVNILSELSKVGRFVGAAPAQSTSGTALQRLSGSLNVQNGVATTNNLVAAMSEGSLSATGSMDLTSQALNMHVTAVLNSGASTQVGGNGIGGFLNTALANNKGELVLPVIVTGAAAHPVFAPDVQQLAKMKLNHLLPTSGDPTKLTNGLLGAVLGKQGNTNQPANPLQSILGGLGKKKPQ